MFRRRAIIIYIGIFFAAAGGFWNAGTSRAEAATLTPAFSSYSSLHPVEIDIPSIEADIPVISVGVTASDNLDVPHNFVQAGWYKDGPVPGEAGTAVIDGHVDNGGKKPTIAGVFKNLNKVTAGNVIDVTQSDGEVAHFKVTATAVYPYSKFPSSLVFAQTGESLLNIITCDGTWLPSADTYSQRLVVTAERVS